MYLLQFACIAIGKCVSINKLGVEGVNCNQPSYIMYCRHGDGFKVSNGWTTYRLVQLKKGHRL